MKSQKLRILTHIKKRPITALEALRHYGCLRLAARIAELRDEGWNITSKPVVRNGKRVAQYRVVK